MAFAGAARRQSEFELDEPVEPAADGAEVSTLTERLDTKLSDLVGSGLKVCWLEIGREELVALFTEGGDEAILLDPDPAVDRAWYSGLEVRATDKDCIWIWVEGEVEDDFSAHVIS